MEVGGGGVRLCVRAAGDVMEMGVMFFGMTMVTKKLL